MFCRPVQPFRIRRKTSLLKLSMPGWSTPHSPVPQGRELVEREVHLRLVHERERDSTRFKAWEDLLVYLRSRILSTAPIVSTG